MSDERKVMHGYRGYLITYDPPPIPTRNCDWHWRHGDLDLDDNRYGHSGSLADAKADIDAQIWESGEDEDDV